MDVVILGAGGFGIEAHEVVRRTVSDLKDRSVLGFLDDGSVDEDRLRGVDAKWLGSIELLATLDADFVVAVGDPQVRCAVAGRAEAYGRRAYTAIDPNAVVSRHAEIGDGTIVCPHAVITSNARVGRHVQVNIGSVIAHDCEVGDYVTLSPAVNLSGSCTVGEAAFLGTGAMVMPGVRIGVEAKVGAGAVVLKDVPDGATAVGVPARH